MKTQKHAYYIGVIVKNMLKIGKLRMQLFLVRGTFNIDRA